MDATTGGTSNTANAAAVKFAQEVLAAGHWKNSFQNILFLLGWQHAEEPSYNASPGANNPLNIETKSGFASYSSMQAGAQATADLISQAYPSIDKALATGTAVKANNSGALAADLKKWSGYKVLPNGQTEGYTAVPIPVQPNGQPFTDSATGGLIGDIFGHGVGKALSGFFGLTAQQQAWSKLLGSWIYPPGSESPGAPGQPPPSSSGSGGGSAAAPQGFFAIYNSLLNPKISGGLTGIPKDIVPAVELIGVRGVTALLGVLLLLAGLALMGLPFLEQFAGSLVKGAVKGA